MSGEVILGNISNVCVKNSGVYLYYDINMNESTFKNQKQLIIYLSKIKKNILEYKTPIEYDKTVKNYYEEKYEVYVLITFYIHKITTESKINNTRLFNVLYTFTDSEYSITINETITFYINKKTEHITITLSGLTNLFMNSLFIKNEAANNVTTNNEVTFNLVSKDSQKLNEMKTVKFVEQETQVMSEYFDGSQISFINHQYNTNQYQSTNGSLQLQPPNGSNQQETSTIEYTKPIIYPGCNYNYREIKFSSINLSSESSLTGLYILPYKTLPAEFGNECDSLYYHCEIFIEKMNKKSVHETLKSITGKLDRNKRKKIKKLFTDNGFNPNNSNDADKNRERESKNYGNFGITEWNYNREYNALKYFYKNCGNNTNGKNPLKDLYNLMMVDYGTIVKYSHMKWIYQL